MWCCGLAATTLSHFNAFEGCPSIPTQFCPGVPCIKCTLDLYQAYDIKQYRASASNLSRLWVEATLLPHILHPLFHHLPISLPHLPYPYPHAPLPHMPHTHPCRAHIPHPIPSPPPSSPHSLSPSPHPHPHSSLFVTSRQGRSPDVG
jgi:hypothetical protein